MNRREFVLQGIGAVAGGLLASCGGGEGGGMTGPGGDDGGDGGDDTFDGTILLTASLSFDPGDVTIQEGDTITWENDASIAHTITPEGHSEWARQEMSNSGETFQHTFNQAGTYDYSCEFHSGMTGTITVEQSS